MSKKSSEPSKDQAQRTRDVYTLLKKSLNLDKRLRTPETYKLLCRLRDNRIELDLVNDFVRTKKETIAGPVGRVLTVGNTPHTIYSFAWLSLPTTREIDTQVTAFRAPDGRIAIVNQHGRQYLYQPSQWVFGVVNNKGELPVDLRKWPLVWLSLYMKQLTEAVVTAPVGIGSCKPRFFAEMTRDKIDNIRRANLFPSQAQKKKVRREQEVNQMDVDSTDEFSSEY